MPAPVSDTKLCPRCRETKPTTAFNRDLSRADGLHPYCTPCKTAPYARPGRWTRYHADLQGRIEKTCSRCKTLKPLTDFHRTKTAADGHQSRCKVCICGTTDRPKTNKVSAVRYQTNKLNICFLTKSKRDQRKLACIEAAGGSCRDCGIAPGPDWPLACFDFHHTDPARKDAAVAMLLRRSDLDAALLEATKCELLCSNCHRRRHAKR